MKGALVITIDPAWPPVSGADHRNWQIAVACARHGPVRLTSVLMPAIALPSPDPAITIGALTRADSGDVYRRPPHGSVIDLTLPAELPDAIGAEWNATRPRHVIIEHLALHPLIDLLRSKPSQLILDLHNIESSLVSQRANGIRRFVNWDSRRIKAVQRVERLACERVDTVWTCSESDAKHLAQICGPELRTFVVPNGIPHMEAIPREAPHKQRSGSPLLLFIGHLGYRPNIIAADRLVREIFPKVLQRLPGARLILAGRSPDKKVLALGGDGIEIVADPVEVAPLLAAADFAVAPLTIGSGTRIKILEAMAWGLPVIATRIAADGLGLSNGVHIQLAETASEFANAIYALQSDAAACREQSEAARRFALEHHGQEAIARAVADGLTTTGDTHPA